MEQHELRRAPKRAPTLRFWASSGLRLARYRHHKLFCGGLTVFHTPAFGNLLLAYNWSPFVHHGLIAIKPDETRWWGDYFHKSFVLDQANNSLVIKGRIEAQPVQYTRTYYFDEEELRVSIHYKANEPTGFSRFIENIPLSLGRNKPYGVTINTSNQVDQTEDRITTDRVEILDEKGKGVNILFDRPRKVYINRKGMAYKDLRCGRIEIDLPLPATGQTVAFAYRFVPIN